jgi:hypothetical protein
MHSPLVALLEAPVEAPAPRLASNVVVTPVATTAAAVQFTALPLK